jgi:hypothetical protein
MASTPWLDKIDESALASGVIVGGLSKVAPLKPVPGVSKLGVLVTLKTP